MFIISASIIISNTTNLFKILIQVFLLHNCEKIKIKDKICSSDFVLIKHKYTYALVMLFRAIFLALSTNQSKRYPDILGAFWYKIKNLWKLFSAQADLTCNACLIHSSFLCSGVKDAKAVVMSAKEWKLFLAPWCWQNTVLQSNSKH